jgi:serine/threonine protein kinase
MDYENKYLKYKQKYLILKNLIGGGIKATYDIIYNNFTLTYKDPIDQTSKIIEYEKQNFIGSGSNGRVYLLKRKSDNELFIFKEGDEDDDENINEGAKSDNLKGIIDDDMLVLFQGEKQNFLISHYNGNDIKKEYENIQDIKNDFIFVTEQLLTLLKKINTSNFYHNDIKLQNVTIKNKKVYLIDFGLLSINSQKGTLMSMSIKGLIHFIWEKNYLSKYKGSLRIMWSKLISTDIFAFFYFCLDLLNGWKKTYFSNNILDKFSITGYEKKDLKNLFYLYYFILPKDFFLDIISDDAYFNSQSSLKYNHILPSVEKTKEIFGVFEEKHTNLFRFMAFIYNNSKDLITVYSIKNENLINFLKTLSDCLLPDFKYDEFEPKFTTSVESLFL